MIRIAVCDDEPCFTQQISHVIANHARDISPSPETVLYTSSGQLLYDVEEGAHFDLLLLDIEMPEKDGMSLAASPAPSSSLVPDYFHHLPHPVRGKGI